MLSMMISTESIGLTAMLRQALWISPLEATNIRFSLLITLFL